MTQKTKITVSGILADLENGCTRTSTSKNYNAEIGCIQDKYNLTNYDLEMLFKHPKLKGKKTHAVKTTSFVLEDDVDEEVIVEVEEVENVVKLVEPVIITQDNVESSENNVVNNTETANEVDAGW
jgi:hypothetical protein